MTRYLKFIATTSLASLALATFLGATASAASLNFVPTALLFGWKSYGDGTRVPAAAVDSNGIVHLRGAMHQDVGPGNAIAFILPANLRPAKSITVSVDLFTAATGQIEIDPNGRVTVEPTGSYSDGQRFTSLEGVTFPRAAAAPLAFTALALHNGWTPFGVYTAAPAGAVDSEGVVHLRGAMAQKSGSSPIAFTLPPNLRPSRDIYVRVTLGNRTTGRLNIGPNGVTYVQALGPLADAQLRTSLDGVSFLKN
jgi:hypothetical protein